MEENFATDINSLSTKMMQTDKINRSEKTSEVAVAVQVAEGISLFSPGDRGDFQNRLF